MCFLESPIPLGFVDESAPQNNLVERTYYSLLTPVDSKLFKATPNYFSASPAP